MLIMTQSTLVILPLMRATHWFILSPLNSLPERPLSRWLLTPAPPVSGWRMMRTTTVNTRYLEQSSPISLMQNKISIWNSRLTFGIPSETQYTGKKEKNNFFPQNVFDFESLRLVTLVLQKNKFYHLFWVSANTENVCYGPNVPFPLWDAQTLKMSLASKPF